MGLFGAVALALAGVGVHPPDRCRGLGGVVAEQDVVGVAVGDLGGVDQVVDIDINRVQLYRKRCVRLVAGYVIVAAERGAEAAGEAFEPVGRSVVEIVQRDDELVDVLAQCVYV